MQNHSTEVIRGHSHASHPSNPTSEISRNRRVHTGEDTDYGIDSPFKPQYVLDDNYTANQIQDILISKYQKNKFQEFRTLNTTKMMVFEPPFE